MASILAGRLEPAELRLERLSRLQGLTESLSAALTPEEVGAIIFDRGLGLVGAHGVTLFWEVAPGNVELVHGLGLSEEFVRRYRRIRPDAAIPSGEAYRTGEPVWLATAEEIQTRFPEASAFAREEGVVSWAAIPLVSDRSRGALGLRFREPHTFDAEERAFVLAVARQCAQALERARLFDAQRKLADRLSRVYTTASALSGASTPREVAEAAFRALGATGASGAEIHALDTPERLVLLARRGGAPEEGSPVSVEAPNPAAEVVRTGKAMWLDAAGELAARYPAYAAGLEPPCEGGFGAVPLLASGHTLGVFAVWFPKDRAADAEEKSFVRLVAQPCAQALERARLFEQVSRHRADSEWTAAVLEAMLASAPAPAGLLDAEQRFVRVNRKLAALNGMDEGDHAGRLVAEVMPGAIGEQLAKLHEKVLSDVAPIGEVSLVGEMPAMPGQTGRWIASAWAVRVSGKIAGVGFALLEPQG
jgi:GAF domain-containing protein